ncbi:MAG TPA: phage baseplate assembly protein V [Roseiflexaceae bacterium]|nr:phage baseplate assembly protein V [Roseiflexaceae bacterium]
MSTMLLTTIQEIIRDELRGVRIAEQGVVEATFPHADGGDRDNYTCDVRLKGSDLLLRKVPVATGHIGTAAIPNVGDLVLLAFDKGDINQPIVIGRLYTDTERPPVNRNDEIIFRLPLQEAETETIKAAVRAIQGREILIELPSKITVQIVDDQVKVVAGQNELVMDQASTAGGTTTVQAGRTRVTINQDGDLSIEAAGNISLKTATGDVRIEGKSIALKSTMDTTVDAGMQANVKGGISANLQGGASASVKGGLIQVAGMATFSPA